MEEEEETRDDFIHEHPLTLIKSSDDKGDYCYGCGNYFRGEAGYGCKKCGNKKYLHGGCAETPREIRHSTHPQHTLLQKRGDRSRTCAVCEMKIGINGYFCTSSPCEFQIHVRCALAVGVKHVVDQQICIKHPSHPQHELVLLTKWHSFTCDACGTMETGRSYVCVACQYWIHERCAALPATADFHHHHPLSLAFYLPLDYVKFCYVCDVCPKALLLNSWVYHCQICKCVVHIKCATRPSSPPAASSDNATAADAEGGLIQFPINDVHEELIKPFVIRERGEEILIIPRDYQKFWFPNHHHQLSLVSSSISEIDDDDDDDDDDYGKRISELICDACTMPIFQKKKHQSSSSTSSCSDYKYMSCGECKYFLHWACFHLPPELPSHPLHLKNHNLILEACPKLNFARRCSICMFLVNGLLYACTECDFKADIKCASLPNTIRHGVHPHHHLYHKFVPFKADEKLSQGLCAGCGYIINWGMLYKCGSCDFIVCRKCVFLPPDNKHELDKHPLPLRYDANLDHPDDFYCDGCEQQMNPKVWMYHCRDCDTSFHPFCFPATSGEFRNIKFGQRYRVLADLHPHPLTFQLLTTKLRCDVCRFRVYGEDGVDQRGFHCSSCNFFMCFTRCGMWRLNEIWAID